LFVAPPSLTGIFSSHLNTFACVLNSVNVCLECVCNLSVNSFVGTELNEDVCDFIIGVVSERHHETSNTSPLDMDGDNCIPCTYTPHTSHVTPHASHLTPHTSHLTPHTSHLTPHTSHLTPHTSHLTPQAPLIAPRPSSASTLPCATCSGP
jgi:hypothetical protein